MDPSNTVGSLAEYIRIWPPELGTEGWQVECYGDTATLPTEMAALRWAFIRLARRVDQLVMATKGAAGWS